MLILGNTAKLYCLNWLAERIEASSAFSILDLGCGTGVPFKALLERDPHVRYVGREPSRKDAEIARRTLPGARIVNALAYDAHERLQEQFDSVVSFSAFAHVYRRERDLRSTKDCLLKSIYRFVPDAHKEAFMRRWLELELWLDEIGTPYTDAQAAWWLTRDFILRHAARSSPQSAASGALGA